MDAFEYLKNDARLNELEWLRRVPFVSYGYVTKVIDSSNVVVIPVVQEQTEFVREFYVTLLSLSSATFELNIMPQVNDLVLLFSLDRYEPRMFNQPFTRESEEHTPVIVEEMEYGYTLNSMVGILAGTAKAVATCRAVLSGQGAESAAGFFFSAQRSNFRVLRNCVVRCASDDEEVYSLDITVAPSHPTDCKQQAPFTMTYGFTELDGELEPVDAPVIMTWSEKAPVERTYGASVDESFGYQDVGTGEEPMPAPVSRRYSRKAPTTITHGASVDCSYGYDGGEETSAPVTVKYSTKAPYELTHNATVKSLHEKKVDREYHSPVTLTFTGGAPYLIKSATHVDIDSMEPVGINAGLRKMSLAPYWTAEGAAADALNMASVTAMPQMGILDAMSGGMGTVAALTTAITTFCTALKAADEAGKASSQPIVK